MSTQLGLFALPEPPLRAPAPLYVRCPRADDPEICACGAGPAMDDNTHDLVHERYVRGLGYLLAPSAVGRGDLRESLS
jgi:hypothetical protein